MNRVMESVLCVIIISWNIQLSVSVMLDKKTEYALYHELDENCFKVYAFVKLAVLNLLHQVDVVAENYLQEKLDQTGTGCVETERAESANKILEAQEQMNGCIEKVRNVFNLKVRQLTSSADILPLRMEVVKFLEECKNYAMKKVDSIVEDFKTKMSICSF